MPIAQVRGADNQVVTRAARHPRGLTRLRAHIGFYGGVSSATGPGVSEDATVPRGCSCAGESATGPVRRRTSHSLLSSVEKSAPALRERERKKKRSDEKVARVCVCVREKKVQAGDRLREREETRMLY